MGRYKKLTTLFTLAVMVMGLSIAASAQGRSNRNNRNNRGNNTGYYGNTNLNSTIRNLKNNANQFENVLDRALDQSRYNETRREDQLNNLADRFKDATERLDRAYDNGRDMRRSADEANQVLRIGQQLGTALRSSRANRNRSIQTYWRNIQSDLRILARAYNSNYNNGRNNRNRGNNGNNRNNGHHGRNDDHYGRDDDRTGRNNGRYNQNLRATIVNLKNKSSRFEDRVDREKNNSRYGNNNGLESAVNRFNDAVKNLEDEYDNRRDYNDSVDEVRRVLSYGEQVDREISQSGVSQSLRSEWNSIEQDLRTLANGYNISYNGRNNNRGYGIGDILRKLPF